VENKSGAFSVDLVGAWRICTLLPMIWAFVANLAMCGAYSDFRVLNKKRPKAKTNISVYVHLLTNVTRYVLKAYLLNRRFWQNPLNYIILQESYGFFLNENLNH